jgi:hypothetical protein
MSDSSFKEAARQSKRISNDPYLTQQHQIIIGGSGPPYTGYDDSDIELNAAGQHQGRTSGTSRRQSRSKRLSASNAGSVPNGGTIAWLQVLASFFLFFNSWGIINTFGMFPSHVAEFAVRSISEHGLADVMLTILANNSR